MESTKIGAFLKESRVPGSPGNIARKITVKLYGKGVFAKQENRPGSENTMYYTRQAGQFIYSKLDFLNGAFGIIPDNLDSFESTVDLPCFDFIGDKVDPDWFLHYVSRTDFYAYQGGLGNGGRKARRISPDDFLELEIDLPPLPEQKKIAEILSGIDHFIEKAEREVMKYESLKQATLYEYPLKYSSGQVLLHECANLQAGGTPDRGKSSFWDGNIPWVKTGEVNYNLITSTEECISEEGLQSSSARLLPKGSILMAMYGQGVTRGRVAKLGISAAANQACLAINSRTPEVGNDYLYWILTSKYEHLRSQVQEGTQKNLNKGIVGDQIIPLLEGRRQEEFCKLCSHIDDLIQLKRREASALSKLKSSLSSDLLSGRKRVSI